MSHSHPERVAFLDSVRASLLADLLAVLPGPAEHPNLGGRQVLQRQQCTVLVRDDLFNITSHRNCVHLSINWIKG